MYNTYKWYIFYIYCIEATFLSFNQTWINKHTQLLSSWTTVMRCLAQVETLNRLQILNLVMSEFGNFQVCFKMVKLWQLWNHVNLQTKQKLMSKLQKNLVKLEQFKIRKDTNWKDLITSLYGFIALYIMKSCRRLLDRVKRWLICQTVSALWLFRTFFLW